MRPVGLNGEKRISNPTRDKSILYNENCKEVFIMKTIMTMAQQKELVAIGTEHLETLVAYGGDMYRMGFVKGAKIALTGAVIGVVASAIVNIVVEIKKETKNRKKKEI